MRVSENDIFQTNRHHHNLAAGSDWAIACKRMTFPKCEHLMLGKVPEKCRAMNEGEK